jgi:hypothetical protein
MTPFAKPAAVLAAAALLLGAGAAAAQTPAGSLFGGKAGTPDISGVWDVVGSRSTSWSPKPAFTPKYKAEYERRVAADKAGKPIADPGARCLPHGLPTALMYSGYPIEIIQTPGRVTVVKENFSQTWRVWTDGRSHPSEFEIGFLGHSVGKWEGDTLVVDIVGLRDDTLLDTGRTMPHSTKLHIVQRWRKIDPETLELRMVADDPEAFAGKVESTTIMRQKNDLEILELFCEAPGFDISADGEFSALPNFGDPKDK